jgi:long-chain fatty acid transport protein
VRRRLAGLVGLLVAGAGSPAAASPLFELWGAQGEGGHSARVLPAGAASTYFNPALLPEATADFDLGVAVVADQIGVRLRGRPSAAADVSVQSVDAERPGGGRYERYGLPTEWLQNGKPATPPDPSLAPRPRQGKGSGHQVRAYQLVGMVRKLLDDRLAVGLIAMIPYSEFTGAAAFYSDEREQYFSNSLHPELYADRLTATSLAFGLGARLGDMLSVGASCTLALKTVAGTPTYLGDVGRFQEIMVDSDVGVKTSVAPHFGAALALSPATRLAATVHTPQKTEIGTDFSFLLPSGLEQRAQIRFTHAYLPWTVGLGASHTLGGRAAGGVTLAATAMFARWSDYVDRHDERPAAPYAWKDTFSGVAGLRYRRGDGGLALDVLYQPSPVPDQTGRTSYVDNDRIGAALSGTLAVSAGRVRLLLSLSAQLHRLLPRETVKLPPGPAADGRVLDEVADDAVLGGDPLPGREGLQTNNPGWPGFSSAGYVLGGGLNLGLQF